MRFQIWREERISILYTTYDLDSFSQSILRLFGQNKKAFLIFIYELLPISPQDIENTTSSVLSNRVRSTIRIGDPIEFKLN